jgi:hypothetical protein
MYILYGSQKEGKPEKRKQVEKFSGQFSLTTPSAWAAIIRGTTPKFVNGTKKL